MDGEKIITVISEFIMSSPKNTLTMEAGEKAWEEALVGFCSGADPIFQSFKKHVGNFHYTPDEIFFPLRDHLLFCAQWI